nr:zinc finger, SWIM-type [Tanacetum cinerariifolium]
MYVNGKIKFVDLVDSEQLTVQVMHKIVKLLKYYPKQIIPKKTLDWGLTGLGCTDDIINLIQYVLMHKVVEVYIEHHETRVESFYKPSFREGILIREIDVNDGNEGDNDGDEGSDEGDEDD